MGPRFTVTPQAVVPSLGGSRQLGKWKESHKRHRLDSVAWGSAPTASQQTDPSSAGPQETTGPSERVCPGPIFKLSLLLHFCQNYKKIPGCTVRPVLKTTLLLKAVTLSQPQFSCLEPAVLVWILRKV